MRVIALVEYEVVGNNDYLYVDRVVEHYHRKKTEVKEWRNHFFRFLLSRGIICNKIKVISVEYVK